jgi:SNF2 family DNA or RNA helicase
MSSKEIKPVILFTPSNINKCKDILMVMLLTKQNGVITYEVLRLEPKYLLAYFSKLPEIRLTLEKFSNTTIANELEKIAKSLKIPASQLETNKYLLQAKTRFLIELVKQLRNITSHVRFYHDVPVIGQVKRFVKAACTFSAFIPKLNFNVNKNELDFYYLDTLINLNGTNYPLHEFVQTGFLLSHANEYFVLTSKDVDTLEFVQQLNYEVAGASEETFINTVLQKIETDYTVERGSWLERAIIDVAPQPIIQLSELNEKYIVFTPRFVYDGFIVDGDFEEKQITQKNGTEYEILRQQNTEAAFVNEIKTLHESFKQQYNGYFYLTFSDAQKKQWFIKAYQKLLNNNVEIWGMDMLKHFNYSKEKVQTVFDIIASNSATLSVNMEVRFGKEIVPLLELQKMLRNKQATVMLNDGSFGVLDDAWQEKYGTIIKHAKIDKTTPNITIPKWLALANNSTTDNENLLASVLPENWYEKWHFWQTNNESLFTKPTAVKATLRNYQQKGFEWMQLLKEVGAGACLADDMGLGKTLQSICFIAKQIEDGGAGKTLIVAPTSLIYNWFNELTNFAPSITKTIFHGANRDKAIFENDAIQVIITTYGTMRSDAENLTPYFFNTIILDESHNIKSTAALVTKAVHTLSAQNKILLSGTPIMNNTLDLYSQLHFALPNMFGSVEFFKKEYAEPIDTEKNSKQIAALQKLTAPFILRRTKEQVAKDLPDKTKIILWCEMDKQQRLVYEDIKSRVAGQIKQKFLADGVEKSKLFVLQGILKMRQACNTPQILPEAEYKHITESAKIDTLIAELENNLSNHKALVFSQFTSMLSVIEAELQKRKIKYCKITGEDSPQKRNQQVEKFNNPLGDERVFLLSLKAGNAGLNLTAADYVFLIDPWWNNAVEEQAIDRAHRIGQKNKVFAYKMVCKNSIEEKIIKLQERKKALADDLITEEEGFVKNLSEEDIAFLFE